jgi:prephenate dehydrogenase
MIERVAILGTGLIGGSLGLAWRRRRPDVTVVGHDRPDVLETADERGAIDAKAADPVTAVEGADAVVFAAPLATNLRLMEGVADHLEPGTFVTDVASVKQPVLDQARDVMPEEVTFVGGHPMAGAENNGIEHADELLFENAAYAVCLPEGMSTDALDGDLAPLVELIEATGARPLVLDAGQHDRVAAHISHLPQLAAVALVQTAAQTDDADVALQLAAGGFRDMTRVADSPFAMWRDILVGNEGFIHDALSRFTRVLRSLRNRLLEDDLEALEASFTDAREARDTIPRDEKGFLRPLADVFVRAPDEPGILSTLTTAVADAGLNIKDIELQKYRDGEGGTFRLGFDTAEAADQARDVLAGADFELRRP